MGCYIQTEKYTICRTKTLDTVILRPKLEMSGRAFRKAINKEYDKRINDEDSNDSEDIDRPLPKSNLFDLVRFDSLIVLLLCSNF
jgi:hypothetical protein